MIILAAPPPQRNLNVSTCQLPKNGKKRREIQNIRTKTELSDLAPFIIPNCLGFFHTFVEL